MNNEDIFMRNPHTLMSEHSEESLVGKLHQILNKDSKAEKIKIMRNLFHNYVIHDILNKIINHNYALESAQLMNYFSDVHKNIIKYYYNYYLN